MQTMTNNYDDDISPFRGFSKFDYTRLRDFFKEYEETSLNSSNDPICAWCNTYSPDKKWRLGKQVHCSLRCYIKTRELIYDLYNARGRT